MRSPSFYKQQRGVAGIGILAALMAIAVITAIAVKQSWRSDLDLTRSEFRWLGIQAKEYFQFAEQSAILLLDTANKSNTGTPGSGTSGKKDPFGNIDNPDTDDKTEGWYSAKDYPAVTRGAAQIAIEMIDAQSKINLNALGAPFKRATVPEGGPPGGVLPSPERYTGTQKQFIRLLQTIPLDDGGFNFISVEEAEAILEAVKDWVDADPAPSGLFAGGAGGGAEQDYYSQLDPPVTISDGPMVSASELIYIKGLRPVLYQGILPYVTAALPQAAVLNVNTMSDVIVRTLNSPSILEPLEDDRDAEGKGIASDLVGELEAVPVADPTEIESKLNLTPDGNGVALETEGLGVKTGYFELHTTIVVGQHTKRAHSLLERTEKGTRVVRRTDASF